MRGAPREVRAMLCSHKGIGNEGCSQLDAGDEVFSQRCERDEGCSTEVYGMTGVPTEL